MKSCASDFHPVTRRPLHGAQRLSGSLRELPGDTTTISSVSRSVTALINLFDDCEVLRSLNTHVECQGLVNSGCAPLTSLLRVARESLLVVCSHIILRLIKKLDLLAPWISRLVLGHNRLSLTLFAADS